MQHKSQQKERAKKLELRIGNRKRGLKSWGRVGWDIVDKWGGEVGKGKLKMGTGEEEREVWKMRREGSMENGKRKKKVLV